MSYIIPAPPGLGYGLSHVRDFPCSPVHLLRINSKVKVTVCKVSFACEASFRRNPDFSKQNKNGFRRQNEDRNNNFENLEHSEVSLHSKNGPLMPLSNSPKFQATAAPGPREKEIVQLFRKVQAQLRERAAAKEEKKTELSPSSRGGRDKESETVDSLLKLLRKHSVEQGKRKSSSSRNFDAEEETDVLLREEDQMSTVPDEEEHEPPALSRPPSSFRRKSPVPQTTFYSAEHDFQEEAKSKEQREGQIVSEGEADGDDEEKNVLSALKLVELRALAKSRGLKGFSKVKKSELIELLSADSV